MDRIVVVVVHNLVAALVEHTLVGVVVVAVA